MAAPPLESLPHGLRVELAEASSNLPGLTPLPPEIVDAAPDGRFRALRHALSDHYRAFHAIAPHAGRSRSEAAALDAFEASPGALPQSFPAGFRDGLAMLNLGLTDGQGGWRTKSARLGDDRDGNQVYFPHVSAVPGQLERLLLRLADGQDSPVLLTAVVAYALLLNCHPFNDGNGRTARVLFNHLLRRGGMPRNVYLPLYEIALRSHGGYEIALRIAEIQGDWEPFLRYMLNAILCFRELALDAGLRREPDGDAGGMAHRLRGD